MKVNLEVKGTLAKLLATEDLIVEHRKVSTASFNVQSRVLTLPLWDRASNKVIDLLVSHEVGHALFTPNEDWTAKLNCPKGFLNVTEDVRIEKKMKRKYPGLPKTFYRGYKELAEQDFFGIEGTDINNMNIADRVNLYFKIGSFVNISFSEEEKGLLKMISDADTFDDAIAAAERMYELHSKKEEEEDMKPESELTCNSDESQGGDGESQQEQKTEIQETEDGEEPSEDESYGGTSEMESPSPEGGDHSNDEVSTMDNLDEKLQEMTSSYSYEPVYIEYPKLNLDEIIVSNQEIHDHLDDEWDKFKNQIFADCEDDTCIMFEDDKEKAELIIKRHLTCYETNFKKFKRDIQSEVNYMVKEFECKKSAGAYARASTSRTGVLDCTKLHSYKYNEDLFKKVTTLPNGKNHGLIFILDWSGSMHNILLDTVKQLLSLVMFCDKVNIPFDVYAFTNEWNKNAKAYFDSKDESLEENKFYISQTFNLLNMISSSNKKSLQKQMTHLYMMANMYHNVNYHLIPEKLSLSGTPLVEAMICLNQIIPQFKSKNDLEKVHTMILTDGEAAGISYTRESPYDIGKMGLERINLCSTQYFRNRKNGNVRKISYEQDTCLIILEDLRNSYPGSTITGFRLLESGSSLQLSIRNAIQNDSKKQEKWKKEKIACLTNQGYDKYFIMGSKKLHEDVDFEVKEDATKSQIKNAFSKSLKSKKNNKKILGEFIGMIA